MGQAVWTGKTQYHCVGFQVARSCLMEPCWNLSTTSWNLRREIRSENPATPSPCQKKEAS